MPDRDAGVLLTYLSEEHFCVVAVPGALVDEADANHGGHLDAVRHVQFSGGGRQQCRDMDAEQPRDGHVHGAQLGGRHTQQQADAGHLVPL